MTKTRKKHSADASNKKSRKQISLFGKSCICFITIIISLAFGTILLNKSFLFEDDRVIKYNEKSSVDYKVYLKKNAFYEQEYLGKDMIYVAALIDKIAIDFNYQFNSEIEQDIDFTYNIVANLKISNSTGTKSYFEKTYTILNDKKVSMKDISNQNITESVSIDYPYYNSLASNFKQQYGVEAESKLTVYMIINKSSDTNNTLVLGSSNSMNVSIPLSERSVDIKLDYKEINETSSIIEKNTVSINDYLLLIMSGILVLYSLVATIFLIRMMSKLIHKKSDYERYIDKILKEYDRLIAESKTLLSFAGKEIIYINKFTELLDIHDNLQLPIMYYEAIPQESSVFYISHENVIYLLEIEADNIPEK